MRKTLYLLVVCCSCIIVACKPTNFLAKRTPHESYQQKLKSAGLLESELGAEWVEVSRQAIGRPVTVTLPFKEKGYFAAERPSATGYLFPVKRGMRVTISNHVTADSGVKVFLDVWQLNTGKRQFIKGSDQRSDTIIFTAKADEELLIRVQPELLATASYEIEINFGPSLAFPVDSAGNPSFISYWGAARDAGSRKHEGVDIRAQFRTPALAVTDGVARPADNRLGGKAVFIWAPGVGFSAYYAHLDSQTVSAGQRVKAGDTIGLIGTTGNAAGGVPHLHFGIYTHQGAINPIFFIQPNHEKPKDIDVTDPQTGWGTVIRPLNLTRVDPEGGKIDISANTPVRIIGARAGSYRIELPDGTMAYAPARSISTTPPSSVHAQHRILLLSAPDSSSQEKWSVATGKKFSVLGHVNGFSLIHSEGVYGWVASREL